MHIQDWLILAVLAVLAVLALRWSWKHRNCCCGNCNSCGACKRCQRPEKKKLPKTK